MPKTYSFLVVFFCLVFLNSCVSVKPYQRQFLNDPEMQMGLSGSAFENYILEIREGSIIPGSAKSSEGCGCN